MSVSYIPVGRLGNNLLQYFACKVFGHIHNKSYVYNTQFENTIRDDSFDQSCLSEPELNGNYTLDGFFQRQPYVSIYQTFLQSLFSVENQDRINDKILVSEIATWILDIDHSTKEHIQNPHHLVLHIRLDDFFHQGKNSEIISPDWLISYVKILENNFHFDSFTIVVDQPKFLWEKQYISKLQTSLANCNVQSSSINEDFAVLYWAKNLFLCQSTFGWVACVYSPNIERNFFPHTDGRFASLNNKSILYTPVLFQTDMIMSPDQFSFKDSENPEQVSSIETLVSTVNPYASETVQIDLVTNFRIILPIFIIAIAVLLFIAFIIVILIFSYRNGWLMMY